jgi:hypothetical protein
VGKTPKLAVRDVADVPLRELSGLALRGGDLLAVGDRDPSIFCAPLGSWPPQWRGVDLADLDLPVVALNRGSAPPPPGSATFALSPEEEGAAAADRLADRRLLNVLVVSHADESAQRALGAFRQRLKARGVVLHHAGGVDVHRRPLMN